MNRDTLSDHGYRLPPEIISHAVWLSHRFGVSVRAVEDLLPGPMRPHGVLRSDPAVVPHGWFSRRARLTRRQGRLDDIGHLDEAIERTSPS